MPTQASHKQEPNTYIFSDIALHHGKEKYLSLINIALLNLITEQSFFFVDINGLEYDA